MTVPNTAALWLNTKGKRLRSLGPEINKELALCVSGKRVPAHRYAAPGHTRCAARR
jgi:hypothetical protein